MPSPSFLQRITSPKGSSPILPLHSPSRKPSEYDLEELDPHPSNILFDQEALPANAAPMSEGSGARPPSPDSWSWKDNESSSVGSRQPKQKSRNMFAGPPPPIAASVVLQRGPSRPTSTRSDQHNSGTDPRNRDPVEAGESQAGSILFNQRQAWPPQSTSVVDSVWVGLRRRQVAIEKEVQDLLDLQAAALIAGAGAAGTPMESDADIFSDVGSSTPTGTFYSTATSVSRLHQSLYIPTRSNGDGNIVPVRQPPKSRHAGLKSVRHGIRKSLRALAELKMEEDEEIDEALSQRKKALARLGRLVRRQNGITGELKSWEEDAEEPLGRELRELGSKYDTVSSEIRALEEKLVGMRNRKRSLKEKMDQVKNQREAGLSGYRGALKEVNGELTAILERPPVKPLELEAPETQHEHDAEDTPLGGLQYLKLIPKRRTAELAKTWWEGEIGVLEGRKSRVQTDQRALEEGGAMWREVMSLVTEFESGLRAVMRAASGSAIPPSTKGKDKALLLEEALKAQLPRMQQVVDELEQKMRIAEEEHWNLLICAIGAELEAFKEAQDMLRDVFQTSTTESKPEDSQTMNDQEPEDANRSDVDQQGQLQSRTEESDSDVPPDLLISHHGDTDRIPLKRTESANDVPLEFLT